MFLVNWFYDILYYLGRTTTADFDLKVFGRKKENFFSLV